jgi:hypothetical protein
VLFTKKVEILVDLFVKQVRSVITALGMVLALTKLDVSE